MQLITKKQNHSSYLKEAPKSIDVTFNRRNLILYALGIGSSELKFTYEDSADFSAFPTFFIVLPFAAGQNDVVGFPSPAMMELNVTPPVAGVKTLLDGERYYEVLRPLPVEGTFKCTTKFLGIHARGQGGALVESSTELSMGGVTYVRFVSGAFLVGAKGFKVRARCDEQKQNQLCCDSHELALGSGCRIVARRSQRRSKFLIVRPTPSRASRRRRSRRTCTDCRATTIRCTSILTWRK